jgi:hypothetical protein
MSCIVIRFRNSMNVSYVSNRLHVANRHHKRILSRRLLSALTEKEIKANVRGTHLLNNSSCARKANEERKMNTEEEVHCPNSK